MAGLTLFALLTALGFLAVRWSVRGEAESLTEALRAARPGPLVLACLLLVLEFVVGGARFWFLGRRVQPGFRLRDGVRTHLYLMFGAGVTPLQLGAGPAQYMALRIGGLPGVGALAILSVAWLGSLFALLGLAAASLWYLALAGEVSVGPLLQGLLIAVALLVVVSLVVTLFPRPLGRLLRRARAVADSRPGRRLLSGLDGYAEAVNGFRDTAAGRAAWLLNISASIAAVLLRCAVGAAVLAALGVDANVISVMARQAIQFAAIVAAPTPGGSGVAEITTIGLMAGIVPASLLVAYTGLWRLFTAYSGILAGVAAVGIDLLRSKGGEAGRPSA